MSKKGSMELGVNAIVILIIALAILGLALSFMFGLFNQGRDKVGGILSAIDLPIHANADEPIKFDNTEATVKSKSANKYIKISVYNSNNWAEEDMVKLYMDCYSAENSENIDTSLSISAPPQPIGIGKEGGYGAVLVSSKSEGTTPGTYSCRVIASAAGAGNYGTDPNAVSGVIFVTVKS